MHRTHRDKTAALWRSRLEECRESGLKPIEYCQKEEISLHTFRYWARELSDAVPNGGTPLELVRLEPVQTETLAVAVSSSGVHLHADGFGIEVDRGFDEETLMRVLGVLGGRGAC